jgi:hypothetical protein
MKIFGPAIKSLPVIPRSLPNKAILWAAQPGHGDLPNGDSSRFPDLNAIMARKYCEEPSPLATFSVAVSQALDRVWIVDPYFMQPDAGNRQQRIDQILSWLPEDRFVAGDVRFLTRSHNTNDNPGVDLDISKQLSEHAGRINRWRDHSSGVKCSIEARYNLVQNFDHLHDRFAIIDDELWHFGATVGGFHVQVSAATRGWSAVEHGAEEFFKMAWDAKSIVGKGKK